MTTMVDIALVKQLRQETDISLAECKKALEEAGGDLEKAKAVLKDRGKELAAKKGDREVGEGRVECYVHATGKTGVLLDIRCETDFVAKADAFKELAHELALQIAAADPATVEELLGQEYMRDPARKVGELVQEAIAKLGENIAVRRFERYHIQ